MTTAIFHGALAKEYGKKHEFEAKTVFLLSQGLFLLLGEKFKQQIADGAWTIVLGKPDKAKSTAIIDEQVHQQLGNVNEVHFYPAIKGKSAAVRVVIGIVLMVIGYVFPAFSFLINVGASMALSGAAEMLAKKPSGIGQQAGSSDPSYFFNGGQNTNEQGIPVPIVFGRVQRAGSVVISSGISVEQLS
jgi:predicted phage tail protein